MGSHREFCYSEMQRLIFEHLDPSTTLKVMDLGSWNRKGREGSLRQFIEPVWSYTGVDIRGSAEDNVDSLMPDRYTIDFPDEHFDAVITMACFEHVHNPFRLMAEAARVLKRGGTFLFSAPFIHPIHDHFDGWRFAPQGVRALFDESGIERINAYLLPYKELSDCWAIGRRL